MSISLLKTKYQHMRNLYELNGNYQLQQQKKDGFMSKRRWYKDIMDNKYWLERVNARTILRQEICLDYDLNKGWTKNDLKQNLKHLIPGFKKYVDESDGYAIIKIYDTTSNGYHVHIWDLRLPPMDFDYKQRRCRRIEVMDLFPMYKEVEGKLDYLYPEHVKYSEGVCINLEHSIHWKTGEWKKLIKVIQ